MKKRRVTDARDKGGILTYGSVVVGCGSDVPLVAAMRARPLAVSAFSAALEGAAPRGPRSGRKSKGKHRAGRCRTAMRRRKRKDSPRQEAAGTDGLRRYQTLRCLERASSIRSLRGGLRGTRRANQARRPERGGKLPAMHAAAQLCRKLRPAHLKQFSVRKRGIAANLTKRRWNDCWMHWFGWRRVSSVCSTKAGKRSSIWSRASCRR